MTQQKSICSDDNKIQNESVKKNPIEYEDGFSVDDIIYIFVSLLASLAGLVFYVMGLYTINYMVYPLNYLIGIFMIACGISIFLINTSDIYNKYKDKMNSYGDVV